MIQLISITVDVKFYLEFFFFFFFFYLLFSLDHIVGNAFVLSGNGNTSVCISQNLCRTDLKSGSMWVRLSLNCLHVWMLVVNVSPLIKLSRLEPSPQDSDFSTVWTRGDAGPQCHEHYRCSQVSLFYTTTKSLTFFLFFMSIKACTVYWLCKFLICKCPMFSYEEKSLKSKRRTFVFFKVSGTPNSCNNKS